MKWMQRNARKNDQSVTRAANQLRIITAAPMSVLPAPFIERQRPFSPSQSSGGELGFLSASVANSAPLGPLEGFELL
jgi:hypothetical protein